jgi:hypothetical protein
MSENNMLLRCFAARCPKVLQAGASTALRPPQQDRLPKLAHSRNRTPSRLINNTQMVGPATAALFEEIMTTKPHPEMGYPSCLGILRLGNSTRWHA